MNRRQILQYTAWLTGASVSAPLAGAVLSGCSRSPDNGSTATGMADELPELHFFAPDPFRRVIALADAILPRTDSPSASDVGVPATVDSMVGKVFDGDYRSNFRASWAELEEYLEQHNFMASDQAERENILRRLELMDDDRLANAQAVYLDVKQQVIAYYLSTEEIGEHYLNYLPIPGDYDPCISVDDVDNKAWAI